MMAKNADEPQFQVFENASRAGLVHVAVGTGTDGYDITPQLALELAEKLTIAATAANEVAGPGT